MERTQRYSILVLSKLRWCYTTGDDSPRRFLAQQGVPTLLRHCFEWLHIVPISHRCVVAKNRRCESSRVTSAFSLRGSRRFCWGEGRNFDHTRACSRWPFRSIVSNRRVCFILKTETGICAKRCSQTYGSWDGGARRTRSCCCNRWK